MRLLLLRWALISCVFCPFHISGEIYWPKVIHHSLFFSFNICGVCNYLSFMILYSFYILKYLFIFERERESKQASEHESRVGAQREGDRGSKLGSVLTAESHCDAGLKLTNHEIRTWAELGCLTDWATQAPLLPDTLNLCLHCFLLFVISLGRGFFILFTFFFKEWDFNIFVLFALIAFLYYYNILSSTNFVNLLFFS